MQITRESSMAGVVLGERPLSPELSSNAGPVSVAALRPATSAAVLAPAPTQTQGKASGVSPAVKHILLFVDDDPNILRAFRRMYFDLTSEFELLFAESGALALAILETKDVDVVVSDMRMPMMDGAELSRLIAERYPKVIRFILSGHSEQQMIARAVPHTHQFFAKPCGVTDLCRAVRRAIDLRDVVANEKVKRLVSETSSLAPLASLYREIEEAAEDPNTTCEAIGAIISRDVAMTAELLRIANSAYFGLRKTVSTPEEAVSYVGTDTVRALVLGLKIFNDKNTGTGCGQSFKSGLWAHSFRVAGYAQHLAREEDLPPKKQREAFVCGILHDIGKLVLFKDSEEFGHVLGLMNEEHLSSSAAERQIFLTSHSEVGAYLLGLWGLPESMIDAVLHHHAPMRAKPEEFDSLAAVHLANRWDLGEWEAKDDEYDLIDELGLRGRVARWQQTWAEQEALTKRECE